MLKRNITTQDRAHDRLLDQICSAITTLQLAPASTGTTTKTEVVNVPGNSAMQGTTVNPVEATSSVGSSFDYAPTDHAHAGVSSFNGSTGAVTGVSSLNGAHGALTDRYTGTVVLASPSTSFAVTHGLAVAMPYLVSIQIYSSAGVQIITGGATFVFTTDGLTITFLSPLSADTYTVLVLS